MAHIKNEVSRHTETAAAFYHRRSAKLTTDVGKRVRR